ncbi:MAG: TolC family protein [Planctomycetota bacterium]|nr:MAG: TolC family protein [Planctomycetota bacterium]REJ91404.1 MAG: TolC family protein [Planctomycetota bacterium]REK18476.1 MAG: TolC family protein [Planctomycetota bacterium]REK39463.1 MAG: TolC family protein [Planctomycetota bacterium]
MVSRPVHRYVRSPVGVKAVCLAVWLCAPLLAGCPLPWYDAPPLLTSTDYCRELRTIDGIVLEQESVIAPVPLEEAIAENGQNGYQPEAEPPREPPAELPLSLGEARAAALVANLDIGVELLNPLIARQGISAEAARFESTFNASIERRRLDPPPGVAAGGVPDTTFDDLDLAFTQPLSTGGVYRLLHDVTKSDIHVPGLPNITGTDLGVEFSHPLLRDFGYRVNTAGIQIARANSGIADAQSKLTAIRVLAEVETAYWNLFAAQRLYDIAQQQLELAKGQLEAAERLVQAGRFSNVEVLRAQAGVLARRDAAIAAETNVRLVQRELKRIMQRPDLPVESITKIIVVTSPRPVGLRFDRQNLAARAVENRMEALQLRLQLLSNDIEILVEKNSKLPRLDLTAEIDVLGQDRAYRRSLDNLLEGEFGDRLVGLSLEVPLAGNVAATARLREAELRRIQTQIQQKQLDVAIVQEVYDAIDRIEQNWQRILATRAAAIAAEQTFLGESRLNQAGQRTSTEVFIALTNLADAQAQAVQAITDYETAKVDLALAAGAMLGYGQVHWNPYQGADGPPPTEYPAGPGLTPEPLPPGELPLPPAAAAPFGPR